MTSKKAVLFYSLSGNTKKLVSFIDSSEYDIFQIKREGLFSEEGISFNSESYSVILFGTSTLGRGEIPKPVTRVFPLLKQISGKKIFLFGSGNAVYPQFCGALDLLEKAFSNRNQVIEVFKFEESPREDVIELFLSKIARL